MKLGKLLLGVAPLLALASVASAQEAQNAAEALKVAAYSGSNAGWIALGAGFAAGIGILGAAFGVSRAASAGLEGIARNPGAKDQIFTPMIIGMAFIEGLGLFAFAMAFLLVQKI